MTTTDTILSYITQHKLISPGQTIIIGLSGGPDSVFLTHILVQLQGALEIKLIAAHLDHEWRATSAQDAVWCRQFAESLTIPFVSKKISELDHGIVSNGSKEAYAREARRYFFKSLIQEYNADAIALGHHAQDQQETFFIRLARGTTLSGLGGIKKQDGIFIRPVLDLDKSTILSYLQIHNLDYRIDETNESKDFLRNRIRLTLMPELDVVDPRMKNNLLRTIDHLQETERYLHEHTLEAFAKLSTNSKSSPALILKDFLAVNPYLQKRILLHFLIINKVPFTPGEALLNEILRFLKNNRSATHMIHEKWGVVKERGLFFIQPDL